MIQHCHMLHSVLTDDKIRANSSVHLRGFLGFVHISENGCNEILVDFWIVDGNQKLFARHALCF